MPKLPYIFTRRNVQPPTYAFVSDDEGFLVRVVPAFYDVTIELRARMINSAGEHFEVREIIVAPLSAGTTTAVLSVTEGCLLGLTVAVVAPSAYVPPGDVYVVVALCRGITATPYLTQVLIANYVSGLSVSTWPGAMIVSPTLLKAEQHASTFANAPLGTERTFVAGSLVEWRLYSMLFQLTTSAVPGNRIVTVQANFQGSLVYWAGSTFNHPPSTTQTYIVSATGVIGQTAAGLQMIPWPEELWFPAGQGITTFTPGLDAGDQYTVGGISWEPRIRALQA